MDPRRLGWPCTSVWARRRAPLVVLVLLGLAVGARGAAERAPVVRGARLFAIYCASCHGAEARGDGPMLEVLGRRPSDLTRLARRGAGWREETRSVLSGSPGVDRAGTHGSREMPVWGMSLMDRSRVSAQGDEVRAEIDCLLSFLEEIQDSAPRRAP